MSGYRVLGDWGTSRLRLFRVEQGLIVDRLAGPGIAALDVAADRSLAATLAPWSIAGPPERIDLCGMVGSRNGWHEAPYADCPADLAAWRGEAVHLSLGTVPVTIAAGLACLDPGGRPDVMRGEETQIFGALALDDTLGRGRHLLALPGTHGKWAVVEDGTVIGFRTFLTGELFALLRDRSTLLRAGGEAAPAPAPDDEGFAAGVTRIADGEPLLGALFEARSAQLRVGRSQAWATGFLSGLLIAGEVAAMLAHHLVNPVILVGDPALLDRYGRALDRFGRAWRGLDGDRCVIAGLERLEG